MIEVLCSQAWSHEMNLRSSFRWFHKLIRGTCDGIRIGTDPSSLGSLLWRRLFCSLREIWNPKTEQSGHFNATKPCLWTTLEYLRIFLQRRNNQVGPTAALGVRTCIASPLHCLLGAGTPGIKHMTPPQLLDHLLDHQPQSSKTST